MGLRDIIRVPKTHRQTRSETRGETIRESIEGSVNVGLNTGPRFTGSTPDFGANPLASSSATHIQESKGV